MSADDFRTTPLAVVGMACRLAGADNLDDFWKLLVEGRHGISILPPDRLNQRLYYSEDRETAEKSYSRIAGTVRASTRDHKACPVSPDDALRADPTHLTMCEVACAAVQHAGYGPGLRSLPDTAVFVGNCTGSNLEAEFVYHSHAEELSQLLREAGSQKPIDPRVMEKAAAGLIQQIRTTTTSWKESGVNVVTPAAAAKLIQHALNLSGPAIALDAACASSFVAIHLAAMSLHRGRTDAAVVGAFSYRNWWEMVLLSPTQTMSATHSSPFSSDADGMVPSDGYAAVMIKTLHRARLDGDQILGIIRSMGVSSDGRGKTFWAPRQEGQVAAIRRAYSSGIDPTRLQYIEAHATSTQLGDATEIASLTETLAEIVSPGIPIGSAKANVGHTLEAAGMVGLIKTLLAMQFETIPPAMHGRPLNQQIHWDQIPFRVTTEPLPWPAPGDGHPRRAGIDAFGIGGLNVHMVVDQESPPITNSFSDSSVISLPLPENRLAHDQIAVIGIGQPLTNSSLVREFLQLAGVAVSNARRQPTASSVTADDYVFDWRKHRIPPRQIANANPLQYMLLDAAVDALADGNYSTRDFDRSRVGTVVGTYFTSDFSCDALVGVRMPEIREAIASVLQRENVADVEIAEVIDSFRNTLLTRKPASLDVTGSLSSSTLSSMIAKHLDLMGGALTVEGGAYSAQAALLTAVDLLHSGTCDMVLCAVGQRMTDVSFQQMLAAGKGPAGCALGTGAAAIILKRLSDAQSAGDTIRTVLPADIAWELSIPLKSQTHTSPGTPPRSDSDQSIVPVAAPAMTMDLAAPAENAASSVGPTLKSPDRRRLVQRLVQAVIDLTGYPSDLILLNSDLRGDLGLNKAARQYLLDLMFREFPDLPTRKENAPTDFACLEQLIEWTMRTPSASMLQPAAESADAVGPHSAVKPHDASTNSSQSRTMRRYVFRTVEATSPTSVSPVSVFSGAALILGHNAAAAALKEKLESLQISVHQLTDFASTDSLLQELDDIWAHAPTPHLFLMTGCDEGNSENSDLSSPGSRPSDAAVTGFCICQRWYQHVCDAKLIHRASLAAVSLFGGDGGCRGLFASPYRGGMAGLLKSLSRETEGVLRIRVIDAPENEPPKMIAAAVCRELATDTTIIETASVRGKRYTTRPTFQPVSELPQRNIRRGTTWIVTGVCRSHIASLALQLGRQHGLRLHLIDADLPLDRTLVALTNAGIQYTCHQCDLCDRTQLEKVLTAIRRQDVKIEGILHGAELTLAGQFLKTDPLNVADQLRLRVECTDALLKLTASDPLSHLICTSSAAGRFGSALQTALALGDEMLTLILQRVAAERRDGFRAVTILCPAWAENDVITSEVNQDTDAGAREHLTAMDEATAHVIAELSTDSADTEILIWPDISSSDALNRLMPSEIECHQREKLTDLISESPLIDHIFSGIGQQGIAEIRFSPDTDPFLNGHLNDGVPLLPAVVGIETCVQAAFIWSGGRFVSRLRNLQIQNGFRMASPRLHHARILLTGTQQELTCQLTGDFFEKQGLLIDPFRLYQTCILNMADDPQQILPPDIGTPPESNAWTAVPYPNDWHDMGAAESGTVFYGPQLRTLKSVHHDAHGSWGRMIAPPVSELGGSRPGSRWHTPAALLDGCLFLCDLFATHNLGTRQLPHVIDQIDFGRLPAAGEKCLARVIFRGRNGRRLTWDIWLLAEDGTAILWTQGFHATTLNPPRQ